MVSFFTVITTSEILVSKTNFSIACRRGDTTQALLYGVLRSFASLYKELGHTKVDRFGATGTDKTNQDLISNLIFRGIMYELITILAEYGFNPDRDTKSKEWNNRLVSLWRLLSGSENGVVGMRDSHKLAMEELKKKLPRPVAQLIKIDRLTGTAKLRMSLLNYIAIVFYHHLTSVKARLKKSLFLNGSILSSKGSEFDTNTDNLIMTQSKKGTAQVPAEVNLVGSFSAFGINYAQMVDSRAILSLSLAVFVSAIPTAELTCVKLEGVETEYEDYNANEDKEDEREPLFILEVPEPVLKGGANTDTGPVVDTKPKKMDKSMMTSEMMNLLDMCDNDIRTVPIDELKHTLDNTVLSLVNSYGCGRHSSISEARDSLLDKVTLSTGFQPSQLQTFIKSTLHLSGGTLATTIPTVTDVASCLNHGKVEQINISSVPNEDDHKLLHYMMIIPVTVFIHVHKKMYNTKGGTVLMTKPDVWVTKLEQLMAEVDASEEWITTLGNTGLKLANIKRPQKVFIANRSYLAAMGVDTAYKPKISRAMKKADV